MGHYLGIDVGTGSARAGIFSASGTMLGRGVAELDIRRGDHVEQSSAQIWEACGDAVRAALSEAAIDPCNIVGIGFDATCSLVVTGAAGETISVGESGEDRWNVVVWMDHRAVAEAAAIDASGAPILARTGGRMSPEMQLPKLLWLRHHLPQSWARAAHFHDLCDWLVHRATDTLDRSLCALVCKWTYRGECGADGQGWDSDFLRSIGLGELADERYRRIGRRMLAPGERAGKLKPSAAADLGLVPGIAVAAGAIDAYSGALGVLGLGDGGPVGRLALVGGTSSCQLTLSSDARFVPGIWGPYHGALVPGLWVNEAGQSASGALVDHLVTGHSAYPALVAEARAASVSPFDLLNRHLAGMAGAGPLAEIARNLHIVPDFHGNRAPLGDPARRGVMAGLGLETGRDALALLYLAALQALAYGTRHIVETLAAAPTPVDSIAMCGGLAANPLYRQLHADVTGCPVVTSEGRDAVLLGSAMLAAVATGDRDSLFEAMDAMAGAAVLTAPSASPVNDRKYRVMRRIQADQDAWRAIMEEGNQ